MLGDFILEVVTSIGPGPDDHAAEPRACRAPDLGLALPVRQPVYYVLDEPCIEEWGVGIFTGWVTIDADAGECDRATRLPTTSRLNFTGPTRCY